MSTKRKPPTQIARPVVKRSAKQSLKPHVNESETAVSHADIHKQDTDPNGQIIEISSDSGSSEYDDASENEDRQSGAGDGAAEQDGKGNGSLPDQTSIEGQKPSPAAEEDRDVDMPPAGLPNDVESDQEPTLGELARVHDTIDVPSTLTPQSNVISAPGRSLAPPTLASLGTVLSQALRTDDSDLLESCLHTTDLTTVRNTIQRLESTLAGTLLTKLAARMHRRPGRAGSLMIWVQWTLVSHGGALATQPTLVKRLSDLHRVLDERSRGLSSLLALKGKLDLLEAQMELRRGMQRNSGLEEHEEDEEGVIYVEGDESDAEVVNGMNAVDDGVDDDFPVTNGIDVEDSDDDEESSDRSENEEEELDVEEELDENDVNHDDVESDDEDSEAEVVEPQAKRSRRR